MLIFGVNVNFDFKKIVENENFSAVIMAILIAVIAADIFFIFIPEIKTIKTLNSEISLLDKKLKFGKQELADIESFQSKLKVKKKELKLKEDRFSPEDNLELVIEKIDRLASESDLQINQINPIRDSSSTKTAAVGEELFIKIPILVKANSSYHNLGKFLSKLEQTQEFLEVSSFEIRLGGKDYRDSPVSLDIKCIMRSTK